MGSVYHYCSVDTFLKIVQSKAIRLSDIGKSNDSAERIYIVNKIHEELIKRVEKQLPKNILKGFLETEELCRGIMNESCILYAMCFSEEKDLLSQWRGYANNGMGVSIGFSKKILDLVNEENYGLKFRKICYEESEQKRFVEEQVQIIIDTIPKKNLFAAFAEVYENNIEYLGCMKGPGFSEEKEWRLCKSITPESHVAREAKFQNFKLSKVREQCIRDQIVTYFDLSFEEILDGFITEVIIGPSAKITENDIQRCLYINGLNPSKIQVIKSEITYR